MKKIPAYIIYSFSIGFFISLLVGFIKHNPAGIVFGRAIISASLFTLIVYLCRFLIKKYAPDVLIIGGGASTRGSDTKNTYSPESSSEDASDASMEGKRTGEGEGERGTIVDYVVADDQTHKKFTPEYHEKEGRVEEDFVGVSEYGDVRGKTVDESIHQDSEKKVSQVSGQERKPNLTGDRPLSSEEHSLSGEKEEKDKLPPLEELLNEEDDELIPSTDEDITQESTSKDSKLTGNYIKIRDRKFPYDPELFAKAIKKVMREDETR